VPPKSDVGAVAALAASPASQRLAVAALLAGGFLPPVDFFIVNVALSSIHETLGTTPAETELVISAYAAGFAVCLIVGGRLGDLFGRRCVFQFGMAVFTVANLICGIAATPTMLLAGRLLQGVSAAMVAPQILASLRSLFTEPRALARAMSAYGMMMGLAAATGQFAGGALIQWNPLDLGWRAVFMMEIPICLATIIAVRLLVPETSGGQRVKLDLAGAVLLSLALTCIVVPLSKGRELGWPSWIFLALAAGPVLALWFFRHENRLVRHGGMPLLDTRLLAIPSFRRGVLVGTLFYFTTAFYFLYGVYQQEGLGVAPLDTGLAILPYGVGLFLGPLTTRRLSRLQPRLLAIGMAIQVFGYALVGLLVSDGVVGPPLSAMVFVAGFGQGIAFPRLYNTVLADVPPQHAGVAAGVFSTALQVGASVSAAAIGTVFFSVLGNGSGERAYAHGFSIAQWVVSTALFLAMIIAVYPDRRPSAAP
jgi:MFS family permease